MFKRTLAIGKKEIRQLMRDKRMLFVLFMFPIILLIIFGYAINFDVHHVKMVIYDRDKSVDSRDYVNALTSSDYFDLVGYITDENQIKQILDTQEAQCVIVFPENMSRDIYSGRNAEVQILVDGVNGNTAGLIGNYLTLATASYSQKISNRVLTLAGMKAYSPVNLESIFWFNPSLTSTLFLIPGLIAMILMITAVVAISLSIVREKERGTIEQIHVSPLSSIELLLGKTVPYVIIGLFIAALILVAGHILFGMPVKGSYILLFLTTLLYLFAASNLGIFVSSVADSQQVAFQIATLVSLLPSVILSGFIFPIESMPAFIQVITNITPAKFYIVILRSILLKGVGIAAFWHQIIYLFIFAFVFLGLATLINKKSESEK